MNPNTSSHSLSYVPSANDPLRLVARFNGMQERFLIQHGQLVEIDGELVHRVPVELWTLTHALPGLVLGSTYTRATIERALAVHREAVLASLVSRCLVQSGNAQGCN